MITKQRTELCRAVIRAGKELPRALMSWNDEQAYLYFKTYHEQNYRLVCGLKPKLEIVR